jgi:SPP1 gp7 family putative phage head morphogenesis protein
LDDTESDLAGAILLGLDDPTKGSISKLLNKVSVLRSAAWRKIASILRTRFGELSDVEIAFLVLALEKVLTVEYAAKSPDVSQIVKTTRFEGFVLADWMNRTARADIDRIQQAILIGIAQGQSASEIVTRVVGSKAQKGRNGVTKTSRSNLSTVIRTGTIGTSSAARTIFALDNKAVFAEELYVATLDSRTTPICRGFDGKIFPVGIGPIPPLHFNCRSLRVPVISEDAIGTRDAKALVQAKLVSDFSKGAAQKRNDLAFGQKGAYDKFERKELINNVGDVPDKVTYSEWLAVQTVAVQNDILGPTRGKLFRSGKIKLTQFVNRSGDEIPLDELMKKHEAAFAALN